MLPRKNIAAAVNLTLVLRATDTNLVDFGCRWFQLPPLLARTLPLTDYCPLPITAPLLSPHLTTGWFLCHHKHILLVPHLPPPPFSWLCQCTPWIAVCLRVAGAVAALYLWFGQTNATALQRCMLPFATSACPTHSVGFGSPYGSAYSSCASQHCRTC